MSLLHEKLPYPLTPAEKIRIVLAHACDMTEPIVAMALDQAVTIALAADAHDHIGYHCRRALRHKQSIERGGDDYLPFALVERALRSVDEHVLAALDNFVDVAISRNV